MGYTQKITAIKLYILENPAQKARALKLIQVPNLRRIQYTHTGTPNEQPAQQNFIEVVTDAGISGRCTTTMTPAQAEILRNQVVGEDPLHREHLYQKLLKGTRWLDQPPGWCRWWSVVSNSHPVTQIRDKP